MELDNFRKMMFFKLQENEVIFSNTKKNLRSIKQPNPKKAVRMTQPMTSRQTVTMENAEIKEKHNLRFRSLFNLNYLDEIDTL